MTFRTRTQLAHGTTKSKTLVAGRVAAMLAASMYVAGVSAQTLPPGYTQDWSNRHLVFSNPGTYQEAVQNGSLAKWLRITSDRRYIIQQRARSSAAAPDASLSTDAAKTKKPVKKDWSTGLGGLAATLTGVVGALNSSSITGSSTLTVDSVILDASPPTAASSTGTFTGNPTAGQNVTITNGANSIILTPSLGTPASQTGTFSSAPTSSSAITVVNGSNTLTLKTNATGASVVGTAAGTPAANTTVSLTSGSNTLLLSNGGTGANVVGTFSAPPLTSTSISVTSGSNTLAMKTNGTGATIVGTAAGTPAANTTVSLTTGSNTLLLSNGGTGANVIGTFAGPPTSSTAISITSNANTLSLTNNGTKASVTGTATGAITGSVVLNNGLGNTLTLTPSTSTSATGSVTIDSSYCVQPGKGVTVNGVALTTNATDATGTVTIGSDPGSGATIIIGGVTYTFESTLGSTAYSVKDAGTGSSNHILTAENLAAAIMNNSSLCGSATPCFANVSAANTSVTASNSGSDVTNLTATCAGTANNLSIGGTISSDGSTTAASNGSTSGSTFALPSTVSNTSLATNIASAITAETSTDLVTATAASGVVNITANTAGTAGNSITLAQSFVSGATLSGSTLSGGSSGADACTSATTGTFISNSTAATEAGHVNSAINACNTSYSAVGFTSTISNATITVTAANPGAATFTNPTSGFTWSSGTSGSNGTNTCSSSTVGTFATGASTTILAQNLQAALALCPAASGISATQSTNTVTVTDTLPGSFTTFSVSGGASGIFTWGTINAGTNGSNACASSTSGTYATSNATATLASNLSSAITACNTSYSAVGATSSYTSGSTFTVTDTTPGNATNAFSGTQANAGGIFSWGTVTAGTNGSASCTGSTSGTFATSSSTATLASNLSAAITACNTSNSAVGATSSYTSGSTFTVTDTLPGSFTTFSGGTANATGIFSWGSVTAGTNGSGACTSSTTGTYATSNVTATLASNLNAAINACNTSYTAVGATSSYTSGSTFTVTDTTPGNAINTFSGTQANATGIFSWGSVTPGTNGSNTCTSSTTGTFATSSSTTTLASNLSAAINACPTGTGLTTTSTSTGSTVTVTASTWGTPSSVTLTPTTAGFFAWSSGTLTGGTNGTNTGTSFAIDNVTADAATNLAAAIQRNGSTVSVGAASGGSTVTVTATTPGTGGNSIGLAETLSNFSFSGSTLANGADGTNSSTTFAYWSVNNYLSSAQVATNIANAINTNATLQGPTGVGAVPNMPAGGDVIITANTAGTAANSYAVSPSAFSAFAGGTLSGGSAGSDGTVQPNAYPAKFSFTTSGASCTSDFVVYPTGTAVSSTQASIASYNELYGTSGPNGTGCGAGASGSVVPSVFWSYATGGVVTTSPIISFDNTGSQVAFIQENSSGVASLVLLKWAAGTSGALTAQSSGSAYQSCAAPCMYTVTFHGSTGDTFSSPFYDYHDDVLYVGDDSGNLHQFTGVFNGAPAENTTSPWPVSLGSSKLASPVYDPTWVGGQVFVGDFGGVLHCVTASTGAISGTSSSLGGAIADAPLINGSANYVIAFVSSDAVYGFSEQFFPGGEGGPVGVGTGGTGYYLYAGTFDNLYYQSSNNTGNIYVVGNTGVTTGATLYQVGLSGGFLTGGAPGVVTGLTPSATGAYPWPSPVTEFCNPGTNGDCSIQTASGCTVTHNSETITCTTADFTSVDVGATITGTDIPSGATITAVNSTTSITISAGGTASTTTGTATITAGVDYVFFSVNRAQVGSCTDTAGNGCILSYNVTTPTAVVISGSGANVTTPGTNGCWATGGIVIDNSVQTGTLAGASEIYFANLDGNAAGTPVGSVKTSTNCSGSTASAVMNGVQDSQASP